MDKIKAKSKILNYYIMDKYQMSLQDLLDKCLMNFDILSPDVIVEIGI